MRIPASLRTLASARALSRTAVVDLKLGTKRFSEAGGLARHDMQHHRALRPWKDSTVDLFERLVVSEYQASSCAAQGGRGHDIGMREQVGVETGGD